VSGNGVPSRLYAFLRHIQELGEEQPVPLGKTVEAVGIKLANNPDLLSEIENVIETVMAAAGPGDRAKFAGQLREFLNQKSDSLKAESAGCDPQNNPAYVSERERVLAFMRKHGLKVGGGEEAVAVNARILVGADGFGR
jgi:hypothetical protein